MIRAVVTAAGESRRLSRPQPRSLDADIVSGSLIGNRE
jgi:hypothetical protein